MSSIKAAVYESELFGAAALDVVLSRVADDLVITPKNNAAPVKTYPCSSLDPRTRRISELQKY